MHGTSASWLAWVEGLPVAVAMRQSLWLYPTVEIIHIVGFVIVVGTAALFDLRLLGLSPGLPVVDLARHLVVWSGVGLCLIVPSGLLMFAAHATETAGNAAFQLKLLLIAATGINALIFRLGIFTTVDVWGGGGGTPTAAKLAGIVSLILWAGVLACGRLLAYL